MRPPAMDSTRPRPSSGSGVLRQRWPGREGDMFGGLGRVMTNDQCRMTNVEWPRMNDQ